MKNEIEKHIVLAQSVIDLLTIDSKDIYYSSNNYGVLCNNIYAFIERISYELGVTEALTELGEICLESDAIEIQQQNIEYLRRLAKHCDLPVTTQV